MHCSRCGFRTIELEPQLARKILYFAFGLISFWWQQVDLYSPVLNYSLSDCEFAHCIIYMYFILLILTAVQCVLFGYIVTLMHVELLPSSAKISWACLLRAFITNHYIGIHIIDVTYHTDLLLPGHMALATTTVYDATWPAKKPPLYATLSAILV